MCKLEAQCAVPVSLTCWTNQKQELPMVTDRDEKSNLYRGPYIDASY
jgi:hypothetical protein